MRPLRLVGVVAMALAVSLAAGSASAKDLADLFPSLIRQSVNASFRPVVQIVGGSNPGVFPATGSQVLGGSFNPRIPVANLSDQIGSQFQRFPLGSTVAAFTFEFDPELNVFKRSTEGLGPLISERAQTTGKGKINIALSYSRIEFSVFEGDSLDRVHVNLGAGSPITISSGEMADFDNPNGSTTLGFSQTRALPGSVVTFTDPNNDGVFNGPGFAGSHNTGFASGSLYFPNVSTTLDARLDVDTIAFFLNYGVTDRIDVGLVVPLLNVDARGRVITTGLRDAGGNPLGPQATGRASGSSFGFGDLIARAKMNVLETEYGDVAARADLVLPTGDENELRGFGNPAFGGTLIVSKPFDLVSPHANAGFQFRTDDPSQHVFRWAAGVDVQPLDVLTLVIDALGEHRIRARGDGIGNDVLAVSTGLKVNPWGRLVLSGNAVTRLNGDGLRADVIPSFTVEYTFQ